MTRKEFQQYVINAVSSSPSVKDVVVNYIPPPSKVKMFPTVAVDFPTTDFTRHSGKSFIVDDNIHLYVYTRSSKTNEYEDSINYVIEELSSIILNDTTLNDNVTDIYVSSIKTDGGVTYPIIVNRLEVKSTYMTQCV